MRQLMARIDVSPRSCAVLIQGESGPARRFVARRCTARAHGGGPFVTATAARCRRAHRQRAVRSRARRVHGCDHQHLGACERADQARSFSTRSATAAGAPGNLLAFSSAAAAPGRGQQEVPSTSGGQRYASRSSRRVNAGAFRLDSTTVSRRDLARTAAQRAHRRHSALGGALLRTPATPGRSPRSCP